MNSKLSPLQIVAVVFGVAVFVVGVVLALTGAPLTARAQSVANTGTLTLMSPGPAMPTATYSVTNNNAGGPGSLYQAILNANANAGADTITFAPEVSGTIVLTGSLPFIVDMLTINGPGANVLAVSGANAYRVFAIEEYAVVTMTNLTIRDGAGSSGGGILNKGTLALNNANIISNTAYSGGGIYNMYGTLMLSRVNVSHNSANGYGGGISNSSGMLTLINSTLSGNRAPGSNPLNDGGGAMNQFGLGTGVLVNSTLVSNTASITNVARSGIWLEGGTLTIQNSIVAHNGVTNNLQVDAGTFTSLGYNLTNSGAGTPFTATTDLTNANPLLGPLQDNGGTWTHALLPGSPAIDRIPFGVNGCGTTLTTDQREWSRPWPAGGQCDVGAYEAHLAVCVAQFGAGTTYSSGDASALQSAVDAVIPGSTIKVAGSCAGVQSRAGTTQTVYIAKELTLRGGYGPILAGYWKFDEGSGATADDASSYGNLGSVTGATYTSTNKAPTSFTNNSALNFANSTDRVAAPLVTTARDNVTLAAWVNWKGSMGHDEMIALNGNGAYSGYGLVLWNAHSDHVSLMVSGIAFGDSGVSLPSGVWQHVALVRVGGVWTIYVNGVPAAPTWTNTPNTPDTGTFIGNDQNSAIRFNGLIDDARIYNSALSSAQIAALAGGNDVKNNWTTSDPSVNPTILDAMEGGRVAYLTGGSGISVTLENLTIRGGSINNDGGGIYDNDTHLTLSNAIIRDNVARGTEGGGVFVNLASAVLNVNGSQILSNTADNGGGVYVRDGSATVNAAQILGNTASSGGGLWNDGTLALNNVNITSNTVTNGGGGIRNDGILTVTNTTFSNNRADYGGGISHNGGTLTLINSTLSGNQSPGSAPLNDGGGAMDVYGTSAVTIINSTIVSNTAVITNVAKSGIWLEDGTLSIQNSIVAGNGVTNNVQVDGGTFTSQGYNLTNSSAGTPFTAPTDLINTNPLFGPLQDNGGSTWTHALLSGSPAIDRIPFGVNGCGTTIATDQRGRSRPALPGSKCDIGAYEAYEYLRFVYLPLVIK